MTTITIMQPYFLPYAGYFRLLAAADLFAVYDCVQFPRRGWVHRNRFTAPDGELHWLTLPLAYAPQDCVIKDIRMAPNAVEEMASRMARHSLLANHSDHLLVRRIAQPAPMLVDTLCDSMLAVAETLGLPWQVIRTSSLGLPATLRGQDRILAICRELGADTYVNAPGGRELYDTTSFAEQGVDLRFLAPWSGSYASILERLLQTDAAALADDIRRQTIHAP